MHILSISGGGGGDCCWTGASDDFGQLSAIQLPIVLPICECKSPADFAFYDRVMERGERVVGCPGHISIMSSLGKDDGSSSWPGSMEGGRWTSAWMRSSSRPAGEWEALRLARPRGIRGTVRPLWNGSAWTIVGTKTGTVATSSRSMKV